MIVVRNVFKLKFGKSREAIEMWKEGVKFMPEPEKHDERILTDLTGEFYTLVFESTHESLAELERDMGKEMNTDEWRNWYQKFCELVDSGYREVFNVVPVGEPSKAMKEKAYVSSRM